MSEKNKDTLDKIGKDLIKNYRVPDIHSSFNINAKQNIKFVDKSWSQRNANWVTFIFCIISAIIGAFAQWMLRFLPQ